MRFVIASNDDSIDASSLSRSPLASVRASLSHLFSAGFAAPLSTAFAASTTRSSGSFFTRVCPSRQAPLPWPRRPGRRVSFLAARVPSVSTSVSAKMRGSMYDGPRWPIPGRFARKPVCFQSALMRSLFSNFVTCGYSSSSFFRSPSASGLEDRSRFKSFAMVFAFSRSPRSSAVSALLTLSSFPSTCLLFRPLSATARGCRAGASSSAAGALRTPPP